jgi:amidase
MEPMSWALWERSRQLDAVGFQLIQAQLQNRMRALVASLERYDALLTPALAQRPLELGSLDTAAPQPLETFVRSGYFTPFTPVFNASGQPAIALPLFEGEDGLPLAVQLVGRPAGEGALLALAAALEQAAPPIPRRPLVS